MFARAYPPRQAFPSHGGPIKPAGFFAPVPSIQPVQQPAVMAGGPMALPQASYARPLPAPQAPRTPMPMQAQMPMQDNRARVMQAMMARGGVRY